MRSELQLSISVAMKTYAVLVTIFCVTAPVAVLEMAKETEETFQIATEPKIALESVTLLKIVIDANKVATETGKVSER